MMAPLLVLVVVLIISVPAVGAAAGAEWAMKLWAYVTRRELVWLLDSDIVGGRAALSIATKHPLGYTYAYRYWPLTSKEVKLLPDGSTKDGTWVTAWKPYNIKQEPTNATS